ncbi:MAG: hypothetical protein ACRD5G_00725 [Candidatus Acidiferrales bacterium]
MARLLIAACLGIVATAPHAHPQQLTEAQKQAAAQAITILDEAAAAISEIEDLDSRMSAIRMTVPAYARAGRPEHGRELLHRFWKALRSDESVPARKRDSAVMEAAMHFTNLGAPADAAEIAAEVADPSYRFAALSTAAGGYARLGQSAKALEIAASVAEPWRDGAYERVAYACIGHRDFACASAAVETVGDPSLKARLLTRLAGARARQGSADRAAEAVTKARDIAGELPDSGHATAGSSYARCLPAAHQTPRDSALRDVAETQLGLDDFQGARESLKGIGDPEVRENVLVSMAAKAARKKDFTLAFSLAGEIRRPECRSEALSLIALYQYRSGDAAGARVTIDRIPAVSERVYGLLNIAGSQWARDREAVATTLAFASEIALQVPDETERLALLLEVARRQMRAGSREQALSTLRSAQSLAVSLPPQPQNRGMRNWNGLLLTLCELLAETGDLPAAAEIARRTQSERSSGARIARGATRGGQGDAARSWAASLPTPGERTAALVGIAVGILDRAGIGRTRSESLW